MFLQTIKFNTTVPSSFRHSLCLLLHGIPLLHLVSIIFDRQHRHFLCHVCLSLSGFFSDLLLLQCGLDFEQRSFSDVVGSLECVELFLRRRRRKNETLFKIIHPLPERGCHWRVRRDIQGSFHINDLAFDCFIVQANRTVLHARPRVIPLQRRIQNVDQEFKDSR